MKNRTARALVIGVALAVLAGCSGGGLEDIAPASKKTLRPLPQKIVTQMNAKGMKKSSPIMMRIFKEESVLEVWKQKNNGKYDLIATYDICKWSGELGPKYIEGDRQAPEGFYTVTPAQMNPNSLYHLSFNIGFPNAYDRANGRTGQHLMVHGDCSSAGCYSMTDAQMEEIWAFARDAFEGGQRAFQIQAFPFRMTPENMARYKDDPNFEFWKMLKVGYDMFEITRQPPKVDVCEAKYQFNQEAAPGYTFQPTQACPPSSMPESLKVAYAKYKAEQDKEFARAASQSLWSRPKPPSETILGIQEARLVADWTRRRAKGEKVSARPPSLPSPTAIAAAKPAETERKEAAPVAVAATAPAQAPAAEALPATAFASPKETAPAVAAAVKTEATTPAAGETTASISAPKAPAPAPNAAAAEEKAVEAVLAPPAPRAEGEEGSEVVAEAKPKSRRTFTGLISRIMGN